MYKRHIYNAVKDCLVTKHIILIIGSRQVGKTTLMQQLNAEQQNKSEISFFITLEDKDIREAFNIHPEQLFNYIPPINKNKKYYIFIDEIQYLQDPSNFLKYIFDKYNDTIKLIVSGSSSFFIDKKFTDSLAGRKRIFKLPTLSFNEFVEFKNRKEITEFINCGNLPKLYKIELA